MASLKNLIRKPIVTKEVMEDANEAGSASAIIYNILIIWSIVNDTIRFTEYEIYRAHLKSDLDKYTRADAINGMGKYATSITVNEDREVTIQYFESMLDPHYEVFSSPQLDLWLQQPTPQSTWCAVAIDYEKREKALRDAFKQFES